MLLRKMFTLLRGVVMVYNNYVLKKKSKEICTPLKIATFDLETIGTFDNQRLGAYTCGFYDGDLMKIFKGVDCIKQFLEHFLIKKYRNTVAYAHNGGRFDFGFVLEEILKNYSGKFTITPMRSGSSIIQLKITDGQKHSWVLRDSFALIPQSLKRITENFNVENIKGSFDHKKVTWKNYLKFEKEWIPYLINDCKGLYQSLILYQSWIIKKFNVSLSKNITLAQLAMNIFRSNFLTKPITNHRSIEEDIRESYRGGRVEIFKHYGENLHYYDINSLYPYVMKKYAMPTKFIVKSFDMKIQDFGFMYATIRIPEGLNIPLLAKRDDGKLKFGTGTIKGWYCSPEIQKAKQLGCIIDIHFGYKFEKDKLFDGYVDALYEIKQKAKKGSVDYILSKLLMNSLYGKFGQRRERRKIVINPKDIIGKECINLQYDIYSEDVVSEATHILPAIASMVTCYARLELYERFEEAQKKNGTIYYCDTDSLITDAVLETNSKLGGLSDELDGDMIEKGYFLLPKFYGFITKKNKVEIRSKGFPRDLFKLDDIKKAVLDGDISRLKYERRIFATPFESLRREKSFVSMIKKIRSVKTLYDKRIDIGNFETKPIVFDIDTPEQSSL